MALIRLIAYFIVFYLLWKFVRWLVAPLKRSSARGTGANAAAKSNLLVKCVNCGTFITEARALIVRGKPYCSAACTGIRVDAR